MQRNEIKQQLISIKNFYWTGLNVCTMPKVPNTRNRTAQKFGSSQTTEFPFSSLYHIRFPQLALGLAIKQTLFLCIILFHIFIIASQCKDFQEIKFEFKLKCISNYKLYLFQIIDIFCVYDVYVLIVKKNVPYRSFHKYLYINETQFYLWHIHSIITFTI